MHKGRSVLIDGERRVGTITAVTALTAELNLPRSLSASGRRGIANGAVGDFVFVDCDRVVVLARILEVCIPEKFRSDLEHQFEQGLHIDPVGKIQLLATIQKTTHAVSRGIEISPKIGDGVFEAVGTALMTSIQRALFDPPDGTNTFSVSAISLGRISGMDDTVIKVPPENIFGRHCGIFGATGGGKSWTMAKLISEVKRNFGKAIVIDPTGDFMGRFEDTVQCAFSGKEVNSTTVYFPFAKMSEESLFSFLRPTSQSQGPTLREAIRSLKLSKAMRENSKSLKMEEVNGGINVYPHTDPVFIRDDGTIVKTGYSAAAFNNATQIYSREINSELCDFDIECLADQVINECIWPTGYRDKTIFGDRNDSIFGHCTTLINRVENMISSQELNCIFDKDQGNFCKILNDFLVDSENFILLVSFKNVSFIHNARELLLNTMGEYLLRLARGGIFRSQPIVCFLDEAHQFMGRSIGDDYNSVSLDAFGLIAKEGRKYGLTTVFATQRPRDIPQDVLSQIGTFFVHRLTNAHDRDTVERTCGELDRSAAAFIPSLGKGEAILLGPELPAPLPIKIDPPESSSQPSSHGPDYRVPWLNNFLKKYPDSPAVPNLAEDS